MFGALKAGASGFLLKDAEPEELLSAIRAVASGDAVVAPSATRRLLEQVELPGTATTQTRAWKPSPTASATSCSRSPAARPTPRSAQQLYMAEATVKTHVGRLLNKLGARDRVQLVILAYENRLVK